MDSFMHQDSCMSTHSSQNDLNHYRSSNCVSNNNSGARNTYNSSSSDPYGKSGFDLHSLEDFPYNSGTLEMLLEAVGQEYEVDSLESENQELKKKVIELESTESLEREKLRKQEDYLRTKLQQKRSEAQNLKEKRIYQNIESDEIGFRIQEEKKRLKTYKDILSKEMETYDNNRSRLNQFTTNLHDRIRFKTAGMKMENDISLSICGVEIMIHIPRFIKVMLQSPRRRRFYCSLVKRMLDSFELLFSTLLMFGGLLLILYLSGAAFLQCDYTFQKVKDRADIVVAPSAAPAAKPGGAPEPAKPGGKPDDKPGGKPEGKPGGDGGGKPEAKPPGPGGPPPGGPAKQPPKLASMSRLSQLAEETHKHKDGPRHGSLHNRKDHNEHEEELDGEDAYEGETDFDRGYGPDFEMFRNDPDAYLYGTRYR